MCTLHTGDFIQEGCKKYHIDRAEYRRVGCLKKGHQCFNILWYRVDKNLILVIKGWPGIYGLYRNLFLCYTVFSFVSAVFLKFLFAMIWLRNDAHRTNCYNWSPGKDTFIGSKLYIRIWTIKIAGNKLPSLTWKLRERWGKIYI